MDPEEALGRDQLQGLVERQNDRSEVTWTALGLAPPPQDLDLIVLADRAETGNGPTGSQAVECVASVRSDHVDAAPRELIGGDARGRRRVGGSSS